MIRKEKDFDVLKDFFLFCYERHPKVKVNTEAYVRERTHRRWVKRSLSNELRVNDQIKKQWNCRRRAWLQTVPGREAAKKGPARSAGSKKKNTPEDEEEGEGEREGKEETEEGEEEEAE